MTNPTDSSGTASTFACAAAEQAGTLAGTNAAPAVLPTLRTWKGGTGAMALTSNSRIVVDSTALSPVASKLAADLLVVSGLRLPVVTGNTANAGDIVLSLSPCGAAATTAIGTEGNTLYVDQAAVLRATTANGVFYATRTLLQMLTLDGQPAGKHASVSKGFAIDYPTYRERSIMFDVARKFATKDFLLQYMKFMSWYKLNTLHLHLNDFATDANGKTVVSFRLKSSDPAFNAPLSDDGLYYTAQDWADLEAEAAADGITIVPEFDTPGHSQAFGKARPDLANASGFLDPTKPATLTYVESVFSQFLPWFKSGRIHIGGDEVATFSAAQIVPYLNGLSAFLQGKGKIVQTWGDQNYLTAYNTQLTTGLDKSVWIQRWINWGSEASINYKQAGYNWTDSYGDWYIVPFGPSYFNPNGLSGTTVYDGWFTKPQTNSAQYPPIGGQLAVWNDNGASKTYTYETDVHALLRDAIPAAGQVYWSGQQRDASGAVVPYSTVGANLATLGYGPGANQLSGTLTNPQAAYKAAYAANAPGNVLAGGARPQTDGCVNCSNGTRIGYMGSLTFKGIAVAADGTYTLQIGYGNARTTPLTAQVSFNGGAPVVVTFPPTGGWGNIAGVTVTGKFAKGGTNTLTIAPAGAGSNPPDIDGISQPVSAGAAKSV
ncbi:family 20 glycosylhydrolase [Burkholderia alba]|uniref:family 20 glycosylhydrolase n=1 Tax=Burkholderia alba TaxID=2683677 RepID=UPI002B05DA88|nr:family 20 glycosylhydrolase [Burkholderia alba]